jgi:hypothetical protein
MKKKKSKQKKEPPPLNICWRYGQWLLVGGYLDKMRQGVISEQGTGSDLARWICGLGQHIAAACDRAARDHTGDPHDVPVSVLLKVPTINWLASVGIEVPRPEKENPHLAETAQRVRDAIEAGEIEDTNERKAT